MKFEMFEAFFFFIIYCEVLLAGRWEAWVAPQGALELKSMARPLVA